MSQTSNGFTDPYLFYPLERVQGLGFLSSLGSPCMPTAKEGISMPFSMTGAEITAATPGYTAVEG